MVKQITAPEELDALPVGSVGIDATYGTAWRQGDGWWVSFGGIINNRRPPLPLTLLYRPDAPTRWGVFSYDDGHWYASVPADRARAEQNRDLLRADGEACDVVDEATGTAMQNAVNHAVNRARQPAPVDVEPVHDAQVAARALREAAEVIDSDSFEVIGAPREFHQGMQSAVDRLRRRADRIERQGGEQ